MSVYGNQNRVLHLYRVIRCDRKRTHGGNNILNSPIKQEFVIALGANLPSAAGLPAETLLAAVAAMADFGLDVRRVSRLFQTPCFPAGAGPDYVNAVLIADAVQTPQEVLQRLHRLEARFGRERVQRWGSRSLDLDLVAAGNLVLPSRAEQDRWRSLPWSERGRVAPEGLVLPHPRMQERAFVLVPMCDVAPDWRHPALGRTTAEMCAALPEADRAAVVPLDSGLAISTRSA